MVELVLVCRLQFRIRACYLVYVCGICWDRVIGFDVSYMLIMPCCYGPAWL